MSPSDSIIRPKFILEWCELKRSEWHHRLDLIGDRDRATKNLNRKFGFIDEDQTVPIARKTHLSQGYGRAYAKIETDFRKVYDELPFIEDQWLRQNKVSTHEYLLIDNYELADARYFIEQLSKNPNMNWLDVIRLRARSMLKRWTDEWRLAGTQRQLGIEKRHFPYAERRCRRFFGTKSWPRDRRRNTEIAQYRRFYFADLDDEFNRLRVELS